MKNALIPNEKQLVKGIVSAFNKMETAKKGYVYSVIELGEKLIEAKKIVPFGQWENYCQNDLKSALGGRISSTRQALKYMQIAEQKMLVIEYFSDENSVNQLTKAISDATPEQLEKVEQLKREQEEKARQADEEKQRKLAELEAKKAEEQIIKHVQTKEPEIIEGDFTEVQQSYEPEETIEQVLTEANEILQADNQELIKEIDSVTKILESNDQVAAALAEAKKYRELNRVLNERVTGLQNEKNEAIRSVKHWRNRAEKAERELAAIKAAA